MTINELAKDFYEKFSKYAQDLFPEVNYSEGYCRELAEMAMEVRQLAEEKGELLLAHYYQRPEVQEQEVADFVGDSLGLGLKAKEILEMPEDKLFATLGRKVSRVRMSAVRFMGDTVKIILGDRMRVFMPKFSGCSLVASIHGIKFDHKTMSEAEISSKLLTPPRVNPVGRWLEVNPDGIILAYMNSDPESKAKSFSVFTSRNGPKVLEYSMRVNPCKRHLVMPDKYLTAVMVGMAKRAGSEFVNPELIDAFPGACHVHEQKISRNALDEAMERYPNAVLLVHPECGCAVECIVRVSSGEIKRESYFFSTQEMIWHATKPDSKDEFIVATESGMIYTLRKSAPGKKFWPVAENAVCEFMKATTLQNLLESMRDSDEEKYEVLLPEDLRLRALEPIERMLSIV